ncbi:hypothetical protein [Fictibacillus phosphorivorans]|uniref:hypothetical protein n=1 Tax=Fictibacillus phosphorivorans TaxID=1221500 RepID=UPI001293B356|nr:hypothetical protein [Fictibacillus phosphorivorans]MQR93679.1 hypothetical protein [Fictibacillus phosphorivorans]
MRLELFENGIDSLRFGMDFYDKYLMLEDKYDPTSNPGYLKMAVISFHNCLELFSKKLLSDENELLIYGDLSNEILLGLIRHKKNTEREIPLDYYVISDQINVLTIDYIECIKRLGIIFDLSKSQINTLEAMGKIRNKVTHFGLDKTIDFHEILIEINKALNLITDFFYENLKNNDKAENPLDSIYENLLDLIDRAEVEEYESWEVFYANNFQDLNYTFDSLNENEQFKSELMAKGFTFEVELGAYSHSSTITFRLLNKRGELNKEIQSTNIPRLNSTVFTGGTITGPIYFVIDHSKKILEEEKYCYIYHKPKEQNEFEFEDQKFWEEDLQKRNGKQCYGTYFNEDQLIRIIKNLL